MIVVEDVKWSDTGKRVDFKVTVYSGSAFWGDRRKAFSWKCFVLGAKADLTRFYEREEELAELTATSRERWLENSGKRYYNHLLQEGLSLRVWKNSYRAYE